MDNQINENKCKKKIFNTGFLLFLIAYIMHCSGFEKVWLRKIAFYQLLKYGAILGKLR